VNFSKNGRTGNKVVPAVDPPSFLIDNSLILQFSIAENNFYTL
jgi:hypothetical protein